MPTVLLSVDVILQNFTNELLTLEGISLLRGEWGPPGPPHRGAVVEMQGSGKWSSVSTQDDEGVEGVLHLGSTKGYIDIKWNLPPYNVKLFKSEIVVPPGLSSRKYINSENLDRIVLMATILPGGEGEGGG